jgi:hypothetical protein
LRPEGKPFTESLGVEEDVISFPIFSLNEPSVFVVYSDFNAIDGAPAADPEEPPGFTVFAYPLAVI